MLELAILGLLQEAPMHGYELRKELATKLGTLRAAKLRLGQHLRLGIRFEEPHERLRH